MHDSALSLPCRSYDRCRNCLLFEGRCQLLARLLRCDVTIPVMRYFERERRVDYHGSRRYGDCSVHRLYVHVGLRKEGLGWRGKGRRWDALCVECVGEGGLFGFLELVDSLVQLVVFMIFFFAVFCYWCLQWINSNFDNKSSVLLIFAVNNFWHVVFWGITFQLLQCFLLMFGVNINSLRSIFSTHTSIH